MVIIASGEGDNRGVDSPPDKHAGKKRTESDSRQSNHAGTEHGLELVKSHFQYVISVTRIT